MPVVISRVDEGKDLIEDHTVRHNTAIDFHLSRRERHIHHHPSDQRNLERREFNVKTEQTRVELHTVPKLINKSQDRIRAHMSMNRGIASINLTNDVEIGRETQNKQQHGAAQGRHIVVDDGRGEKLQDERAHVERDPSDHGQTEAIQLVPNTRTASRKRLSLKHRTRYKLGAQNDPRQETEIQQHLHHSHPTSNHQPLDAIYMLM